MEHYNKNDIEYLKNDFRIKMKEYQQKTTKIWAFFLGLVILIVSLLIGIFPNQFDNEGVAWILPVYGSMALLATLIGTIVSMKFRSEKPFFEHLYREIIEKINLQEGLFLEYQAYDKESKGFNKEGGLFTSYASVKVRRHISGYTENQEKFHIYDASMTTSNGKSQQTHFDGIYFIVEKNVNTVIQVRTNGSPKVKGVKYERVDDFTDIRVFKVQDSGIQNIDYNIVNFVKELANNDLFKRVYLATNESHIHLALWYQKHPARKKKEITLGVVNQMYDYFMSELEMINKLDTLDSYSYTMEGWK